MTGTKDDALATAQRLIERDPSVAQNAAQTRAREIRNLHGRLLDLAIPVIHELFLLHAATFAMGKGELSQNALLAVAMTLEDNALYSNFATLVEDVKRTLPAEVVRQMGTYGAEGFVAYESPLTGRA